MARKKIFNDIVPLNHLINVIKLCHILQKDYDFSPPFVAKKL